MKPVLDFKTFNTKLINENTSPEKPIEEIYYVYYIVGEEAVHLYNHEKFKRIPKKNTRKEEFGSQAEADAFEKGLKAAVGWDQVADISEKEYNKILEER